MFFNAGLYSEIWNRFKLDCFCDIDSYVWTYMSVAVSL